jgi:hypothetical protein
MVEFTVVFVAILLPALMAIFEFAQLSVAKQNLRYAVFDMVRVAEAATESPDSAMLRARLGRALLPTLADQSDGGVVALGAAAALAARPDLFDITYRSAGTTRVDAATALETWELEVRWCRELFFAPLKYLIPALLRVRSTSWFDQACYARESLPLVAKAHVLRASMPGESQLR